MDRKTITLKCKNCGKEFSYSEEAYKLKSEEGQDKPERCNDCSGQNSSTAKSMNSPYIPFRVNMQKAGFASVRDKFAFRGKKIQKEETRKPDQTGMDISITDKEIVELYQKLEQNQVVVMVSPTGTGKSTYVPKRLVQAPDGYEGDFVDRLIRQGQIIITQPRIMATDGTAKTTAKISGEPIGQRGLFGFRHSKDKESFSAGWNKCVSVTDGTLPNWIREGKLGQYSLIMVDEAHERSCNIDLILGFLKRELPKYPQLRVVISSATINTRKFLESFKEAGISCELFDIPSRKKFKKYEHFWRDESASPNCGCWLCKKPAAKRREFWEKKKVPLGRYDLPEACANFALKILEETSQGSIIVFLDGASAIEDACSRIRNLCRKGIEVIPVYRERKDAKDELERTAGKRRVIVATNIAETSITIPDLVYCINSGWIKQVVWDTATQTQKLEPRLHSKDGNSQRGGRLGRNQDGYVYHLFTKEQWDEEMEEHTSPEITRSCLDDSLTVLKASGIAGIEQFPWMEKTDEWKDMSKEMQRANQSLLERGVTDSNGHVVEKALSLLKIPRSSTEASVLFLADELGVLFETLAVLILMSDRDGTPHTGANLYDPYHGFLCWDQSWTARTKSKVWAIHQGLKIGCQDDLDFVIKLAFCFQTAESNGLSKEWADYHCINFKNLEEIFTETRKLVEGLGEEREESLRQTDLSNLDKVRFLFLSAWPDRIVKLQSAGQVMYKTENRAGVVSPYCAGKWEEEKTALAMAFAEEESVVDNYPQRVPVASFMVSLAGEDKSRDLFLDQRFPVGSWVKTKKKGEKTLFSEVLEPPPPLVLNYRKDVWSEEKPDVSVPFKQAFTEAQAGEELLGAKASWLGKEKSESARIVRWVERDGNLIAILSPFSESQISFLLAKKQGDSIKVKISRIIRDPLGKRGWALARTSESKIPVELSELSLSDWGAGLELIEGKIISLDIKDFEADGFPQLSNLKKVTEDLGHIMEEVSESVQKTRTSERLFIDLSGILVEIIKDQKKAVVAIPRENGVVQIFEVAQVSTPGQNLKYLRLNEEVAVRLISLNNGVEISTDYLAETEIMAKPESWKSGQTENKISVPSCLSGKDLAKWNARPEAIEYVWRRSWQYCLQTRIVSLKSRMSSFEEWMTVEAVVEKISRNEKGEIFVHVAFGDNIPGFIPEKYLSTSGVSEGDKLSLCITRLDPLRLADRDTEIQQKKEAIMRWQSNVSNSEDYIARQEEQIKKINYALENYYLTQEEKSERQGWLAEKYANITRARQEIAEQEQKISSVRRELKKLKG